MTRKTRGYKREPEHDLLRDYKLFAIACEGEKREPEYFSTFGYISPRVSIDLIEDIVSDIEMKAINSNRSAPKWVLDRAVKYIEKEGLSAEDDLWFIIDKDRWSENQLREIEKYCSMYPNWNIAISNPCFEIWLYFHKRTVKPKSVKTSCNQLKKEISTFSKGGYHPLKYISDLHSAIENSKNNDSNIDFFLPNLNETKVYQLGEVLIEFIGKHNFDEFIENKLGKLIEKEKQKRVLSRRQFKIAMH
jgi:hypothetical protein